MGNTEFFELCEISSKIQRPDRSLYWEVGTVYCTCGKCMQPSERNRQSDKARSDVLSITGYVIIEKNPTHGARHGPSMRQHMYYKANEVLKKAHNHEYKNIQFSCIGLHLIWATKTRPDEDDGFGHLIPLCREFLVFSSKPPSRAFAAILGGTIVGPVIEVQIVKILDQYGLGIAIPSPKDHVRTSHGMISSGKSRFVDEIHSPNAELRSSAELLSELQKSEGGKLCLTKCSVNSGLQNGYKSGTSLRSRWTTIWRITLSGRHEAGTAESVRWRFRWRRTHLWLHNSS